MKRMKEQINREGTQRTDTKIFRTITLVALPFFWIGFGYALYSGNQDNVSSYSLLITAFSIMNADVLFTRERVHSGALNILAKILGAMFFVLAVIMVVSTIVK